MQRFMIRFNDEKDKVNFVREASKKKYDIDLKCGNNECDGKSLMGIVSIFPLKTNILMTCNSNEYGVGYDFDYWIVEV